MISVVRRNSTVTARLYPGRMRRRAPPRVDPVAELGHARPRPVHDPHVRADPARGDRALRVRHRQSLGDRGGDWDLIFRCAVWGVAAGIVGARLYHVATSWSEVPGPSGGGCSRSGAAVSASGVGSRPAASSAGSSRSARAPTCGCWRTASRRGSSSRRGSAGSATGGTRSSSGSRPICRGGSRSTRSTGRCDYLDEPTFHPTFLYELLWDFGGGGDPRLPDRATAAPAPARRLRGLHRDLLLRPLLDGAAAGRPGPRDRSGCASTPGCRCSESSPASTWYVLSQRRDRPARPRLGRSRRPGR